MKPEDNYQLYLLYRKAETSRGFYFLPKLEKALFLELSDEKFMSEGGVFNEDDYNRFMENPFPEKPRLRWMGNEGGYENGR